MPVMIFEVCFVLLRHVGFAVCGKQRKYNVDVTSGSVKFISNVMESRHLISGLDLKERKKERKKETNKQTQTHT